MSQLMPLAQPGPMTELEHFMFESFGYIIIEDVLTPEEVEETLEASQRLHANHGEGWRQIGKGFETEAALERLIDSYKSLPPRVDEMTVEALEAIEEVTSLRGENEKLRCELSLAKNKMSALIDEFGNMFGGGKDHELALEEIKQKVTAFNDESDVDFKLQG